VAPVICPFEGHLWWPGPVLPFQQLVLEGNLRAERQEVVKMAVPHEIIGNLTPSPIVVPVYFGPWAAIVRRGPRDILSCLSSATGKPRGIAVTRGSVWRFMPLCSVLKL
jgi:hypothetical protein